MSALSAFGPATRAWFSAAFAAPTPVQEAGWAQIAAGQHALLLAPTGSGKTLAAFLWCLDRLHHAPAAEGAPPGVRVLYVSPLKALVYDVERNLRTPLAGIRAAAARQGLAVPDVGVAMRTGDTPQRERRALVRRPAEVLVTTPESLYLLLTSKAREVLRTVETVIIDEIHAVAATKRGAHLALSLERLSALCHQDPQRIGLSATQRPLDEIARFLGGDRPVEIVDTSAPPRMDIEVVVPVEDMEAPPRPELEGDGGPWGAPAGGDVLMMDGGEDPQIVGPLSDPPRSSLPGDRTGVWSAIYPRLLDLILEHRSTILFANSRRLTERLAQRLNELAGERGHPALARAHHGSISHRQRTEIEEALKRGDLPCIVATSSLELGIDMGAVDLVLQVESPGSVASGLQRVGRAGHGVGEVSRGRIFPKFRGDLLEAAVVVRGMLAGEVERTRVPQNPLDVLSQQIVALCVTGDRSLGEIESWARRAYPFHKLSRDALVAVLDMLSGRMPLTAGVHPDQIDAVPDERGFDEIRPLLVWDRAADRLSARKGARLTAVANAGTIPDRGLYGVFLAPDGPRVGQLDEEMVHEARAGEVFLLGASSWRIVEIKRDRVLVAPAPGQPGKMPFWRGQGPGRPADLGRRMGEVVREVADRLEQQPDGATARAWLGEHCRLDALAAGNLVAYIAEQREAAGALPSDRAIPVERFQDELGDWRVCLLSPFGARLNAPWALAIQARLRERLPGADLQVLWTDDGIILRVPEADLLPDLDDLVPAPEELEDRVTEQLAQSPVFATSFREAAGRSLLLPKRRPGARVPLWLQRMKAQNLMASAMQHPTYPVVLEAYRECLQDVFDLPGLQELLGEIRDRRVRLDLVDTPTASPFARSLVFAFVATWLYEGDAPLAERRVQALTIDRALLRELLGSDELRELLDAGVIEEVEEELQQRAEHRRARSADGLHDLLRRLGGLTEDEVAARCVDPPGPWLDALRRSRRAIEVRVGGEERWIAIEDAGRLRDGLGVAPPGGLPAAFLQPVPHAFESLLLRYARTHGPFVAAAVARRWAVAEGPVVAALDGLVARGQLLSGAFLPGGGGAVEYCDPQVMRRIKRRTLARLRGEIEPVEAATLGRFLPAWQGIPEAGAPAGRPPSDARRDALLTDALARLEGCPLPFRELEARILPGRVPGYQPHLLDQLGARGELVWAGRGSLGPKDGRVVVVRREQAPVLLDPPAEEPTDPVQQALLEVIAARGACFAFELEQGVAARLGAVRAEVVQDALWSLVWAGHLTNDTFQPLRGLGGPTRAPRRGGSRWGRTSGRGGWRRRGGGATGGRWSRVTDLLDERVTDTDRGMARASALLDRYGVVGREVAVAEALRGGFSSILPVLYELEEAGQVRQGWFVEGLGGAQFALPGAVDRLRALREDGDGIRALAATDPAQPYGAIAPWPEQPEGAPAPRREAGATVVLAGGAPVLWLGRGARSLLTFDAADHPRRLQEAVAALLEALVPRKSVTVHKVDGQPPLTAPRGPGLIAAGLEREGEALRLRPPL